MITASNPAFRPSAEELKRFNRAVIWSVAIHVTFVVTCLVVPRDWIAKPPKKVLTITLAGSTGPKTTGTTSIGGRTVEQEVPQPKRPEPIRPVKPASEPALIPVKPTAQPAKPSPTSKPEQAPPKPIPTGPQVTRGNTAVDTGAKGVGFGLTQGGAGTGGETDLRNFCCPEYLALLKQRIDDSWDRAGKRQPEKGETEVRFTVRRDGSVDRDRVELVKASGSSILDRVSLNAVRELRMTPLPAGYPDATLTVRVNFPYEGN